MKRPVKVWIENPSAYMSDGSYKLHTDISPRLGFIAYYGGGIHSGVVKSIDVI